MGNKPVTTRLQRISMHKINKARGNANLHGVTPHISSLLSSGDKQSQGTTTARKPTHSAVTAVNTHTRDHVVHGRGQRQSSRSRIPVSQNYLAVMKKRQERIIEPPMQKFSLMSHVSNRESSDILINPVSATSPLSGSLLGPIPPQDVSPFPSTTEKDIRRLKNKHVAQNYVTRKVKAWAKSAWIEDAKPLIGGATVLSNGHAVEVKSKAHLLVDKSTMTMTLAEFARDTDKSHTKNGRPTKSKSKPSASSRSHGSTTKRRAAAALRRKTKSKISDGSRTRNSAHLSHHSHHHRQPRGYYALNDPKIVARVGFEDRNRHFLYRMAAAASDRQNYGMFANHHNLHQNYF